ncbi:MAG: iron ABC transporter permease [Chloroflexota bacterium]|nr:iron ABC transporter permease [Chloroflexota bacterium]
MRFRDRTGQTLLSMVSILTLAILIIYPLGSILAQGIIPGLFDLHPNLGLTSRDLQIVFTDHANLLAVVNSAWLGVATALGATLLGVPLAFLVARTDMRWRGLINALTWIVFFTPSFVLSSAWVVLINTGGLIDQLHRLPSIFADRFFGLGGVIFMLSLKLFPFVYLSVRAGLAHLGSEFSDAARTGGAGPLRALFRIDLPLLLPAILAGAIIVFAEAVSDFGTVATIAQQSSFPLLTFQIFAAIGTAPVDFPLAAAFALLLIGTVAAAMGIQALMLRRRGYQVLTGRTRPARTVTLGRWQAPALIFCAMVFSMALFLPLAAIGVTSAMVSITNGYAASNFTGQNYSDALAVGSANLAALQRSILIALLCATVVACLALPLAYAMERTQMPGRRVLSVLTLTTIAIPGIVLAAGYIFAWNQPWQARFHIQLYGTLSILVLAQIAGALPYAIRLYVAGLAQVGNTIVEAARVQGAGIGTTLMRIIFPLMQRQVRSVWMLVFTGTMFELAAAELLYPAGQPTMPVEILNLLDSFRTGTAMALTILAVLALALVLVLARGLFWLVERAVRWRPAAAHIQVPRLQVSDAP